MQQLDYWISWKEERTRFRTSHCARASDGTTKKRHFSYPLENGLSFPPKPRRAIGQRMSQFELRIDPPPVSSFSQNHQ
jgi:hypothetical protein